MNLFGARSESVYYAEFSIRATRLLLCTIAFSCVNKGMFIFFQSLGKAFLSTALSVLREIVFGVGLVILLPAIFGLSGVLYFIAFADILTFIPVIFVTLRIGRNLTKGVI